MKNLQDNPEWLEYYTRDQLETINEYMTIGNSDMAVFKCECCDEWSACLVDCHEVITPVNRPSKEEITQWCKDNGFNVVAEVIDGDIVRYNK